MILKTNNKLIVFDINNYSSSKEMYKELWKILYNIHLKEDSTNIENFNQYINNNIMYI